MSATTQSLIGNSPATPPARQTLASLQILRGIAAVAVAFYHTHLIVAQPEYGGAVLLEGIATKGWIGVNFFFALSGFIIFYAHAADFGRPDRAGRYLWRRFIRVYPVYWVYTSVFVAAAAVGIGHPDFSWELPNMVASYTLLPVAADIIAPLQVAWTLFYEVGFYLIFLTLILHQRVGAIVVLLWAGAITVNTFLLPFSELYVFHAWNYYFLVGMGVAVLAKRVPASYGAGITGIAALALGIALVSGGVDDRIKLAMDDPVKLVLLAVIFAALILGVVLWEKDRVSWTPMRALLVIGNASYSIYLVHSPVISVLAQLNMVAGGLLPAPLLFVVGFCGSVCAGTIAYFLVERPLLTLTRDPQRIGAFLGIGQAKRGQAEEGRR
ncbi:Acyltransferase 3 family protein [Parvularcula bermudensis HTCC2503]|uniref:Acyltransferase 3 family protein n=1 Tax=Parvularcula bermudensis (strain ATCC BAA-594 / HTCC2503 / KCTC 12087) TaxID=314260 RepID=E0TI83_PARBH|nr:acyltransferase [Parvularcula bermudensis]ADM09422.1 Acyltransferase 3 family protein [Parvularcula bermudensis HTCC2503]